MRLHSIRARALAGLLVLALAAPVLPAHADESPDVGEGPKRVLMMLGCAGSLAIAATIPGALLAVVTCSRLFYDDIAKP